MEPLQSKRSFFNRLFGKQKLSNVVNVNAKDNNAQHIKKLNTYCEALGEIWTITLPVNKDNINKKEISWEWTTITEFKDAKSGKLELYNEHLKVKVGNTKLELFNVPFLHDNNEVGSIKIGIYFPVSQVVPDLTGLTNIGELVFHTINFLSNSYQSLQHGMNPVLGKITAQTWEEYTNMPSKSIACFKISFYSLNLETRDFHTIWFLLDIELLEYLLKQDEKVRKNPDEVFILELVKKMMIEFKK